MELHNTDLKLVALLLAGNEKAFRQFFDLYYPRLFRFALNRVADDHDLADEMAQKTMCKAIDKLQQYRGEASLYTWLCYICRSTLSAHFTKENRRSKSVIKLTDSPEVIAVLENIAMQEELEPDRIILNRELAELITEVLDGLPNSYGDILEWKYVQQMSVEEIASRLNVSMVAVQSALARARKAFKSLINAVLETPLEKGM